MGVSFKNGLIAAFKDFVGVIMLSAGAPRCTVSEKLNCDAPSPLTSLQFTGDLGSLCSSSLQTRPPNRMTEDKLYRIFKCCESTLLFFPPLPLWHFDDKRELSVDWTRVVENVFYTDHYQARIQWLVALWGTWCYVRALLADVCLPKLGATDPSLPAKWNRYLADDGVLLMCQGGASFTKQLNWGNYWGKCKRVIYSANTTFSTW